MSPGPRQSVTFDVTRGSFASCRLTARLPSLNVALKAASDPGAFGAIQLDYRR
jgi:hypothetical protein